MRDGGLKHRDLTQKIIGTFYEVYNELGHGFLESVYQAALTIALESKGLNVLTKIDVPVSFRGARIGDFEADMLVEKKVLLELKAGTTLHPAHEAQLLNYLRATQIEIGILFGFGLKPEFKRMAFDNSRKNLAVRPDLLAALFDSEDKW